MHLFVQACILGLLTGGVYALMASGLTLAFGIMRVINVAQGALIILRAYLRYTLFAHFQIDHFIAVLVIAPEARWSSDRPSDVPRPRVRRPSPLATNARRPSTTPRPKQP